MSKDALTIKEKERRRLNRILESNGLNLPKFYQKGIIFWRLRQKYGIPVKQVADALGVSKTWYMQMEVGYINPKRLWSFFDTLVEKEDRPNA